MEIRKWPTFRKCGVIIAFYFITRFSPFYSIKNIFFKIIMTFQTLDLLEISYIGLQVWKNEE